MSRLCLAVLAYVCMCECVWSYIGSSQGCKPRSMRMAVGEDFAYGLPGSSQPIPNFDPLGFSKNPNPLRVKTYQEAELKHGRLCMLASVGIIVQEEFHPLFGGKIAGPAIYHYQQIPINYFWIPALLVIGSVEGLQILRNYESPEQTKFERVAEIQYGVIPGDIGFDPLNLCPTDIEQFNDLRTKELNNGRLAMLATAGMVAQELIDNKSILQHLGLTGPTLPEVY